jgi:predicted dehydrogenase
MERLRVAIIGAGSIARTAHIPAYLSLPEEVEVVGIYARNPEKGKAVAEAFGVGSHFSDHLEMLRTLRPDLVSVCVPNRFHERFTVDALDYGSHVLCEKPPAISPEAAERMEQAAVKNGRLLSYAFHLRHSRNVAFLKEKVDRGDFGEIYSARVSWLRRRGIPGWGSFTDLEVQGGGSLIDIGVHMLDLAAYLMGYPEVDHVCSTAHALIGKRKGVGLMGDWDPLAFTVEDALFGFVRFRSGASLNLETAFALNMKEKEHRNLQLFGEHLGATVFPLETFGEEGDLLTDTQYPLGEETDLHGRCVRNMVEAIRGREALLVTAAQGVYIQKLVGMLYESARTGKPVIR